MILSFLIRLGFSFSMFYNTKTVSELKSVVYHRYNIQVIGDENFRRIYNKHPILLYRNYLCSESNDITSFLIYESEHNGIFKFQAYFSNSHYLLFKKGCKLGLVGEFSSNRSKEIYIFRLHIALLNKSTTSEKPRVFDIIDYFDYIEGDYQTIMTEGCPIYFSFTGEDKDITAVENCESLSNKFYLAKDKRILRKILLDENRFLKKRGGYSSRDSMFNVICSKENNQMEKKELKRALCDLFSVPLDLQNLTTIYKEIEVVFGSINNGFVAFIVKLLIIIETLHDKIDHTRDYPGYFKYFKNFDTVENHLLLLLIVKYKILDDNVLDLKNKEFKKLEIGLDTVSVKSCLNVDDLDEFLTIMQLIIGDRVNFDFNEDYLMRDIKKDIKFLEGKITELEYDQIGFKKIYNLVKNHSKDFALCNAVIMIKKLLQIIFFYSYCVSSESCDMVSRVPTEANDTIVNLPNIITSLFLVYSSMGHYNKIYSELQVLHEETIEKGESNFFGVFIPLCNSLKQDLMKASEIDFKLVADENDSNIDYINSLDLQMVMCYKRFVILLSFADYLKIKNSNVDLNIVMKVDNNKRLYEAKNIFNLEIA